MFIEYKNHRIELSEAGLLSFDNKPVKVVNNYRYAYKLNKTCISAQGGASGLYKFMEYHIMDNFALVWIDAIIEHMEKITKEA